MYGVTRMFYNNLITEGDATLIAQGDDGVFSGALKYGIGFATMQVSGTFSFSRNLKYIIVVSSVTSGKEIGQAVVRWRTNETDPTSWEGQFTTSASDTALSNGLSVRFTAGIGNDFELGDIFYVDGMASFSFLNTIDERRDSYYKFTIPKETPPWTDGKSIYFRTPEVTAGMSLAFSMFDYAVIYNSGDTSPTIFELQGGESDTYSDYSKTLTWNPSSPLIEYLDDIDPLLACTYWKLRFYLPYSAPVGTDNIFWIGQMFLGEYIEFPTAAMWNWGSQHDRQTTFTENNQNVDVVRQISDHRRTITANWQNIKSTDFAILNAMYDSILNRGDNIEHPVFFHEFSDEADRVYWMKVVDGILSREYAGFNRDNTTLKLMEVAANYVL